MRSRRSLCCAGSLSAGLWLVVDQKSAAGAVEDRGGMRRVGPNGVAEFSVRSQSMPAPVRRRASAGVMPRRAA